MAPPLGVVGQRGDGTAVRGLWFGLRCKAVEKRECAGGVEQMACRGTEQTESLRVKK